jgi:Cu-processing system ATP-binding protein
MIRIENLNKRFKRIQAIDNVSVCFDAGQVVALIGPNGSGKTTLIKCILRMVYPQSGNILFDNQSIQNSEKYRSRIGYMPQIGRFPEHLTVRQLIEMIVNIRNVPASNVDYELYNAFNLDAIRNKTIHSLSGGTRQKVSATLAFMFNPDVLILDEPTAGLDPLASEVLKAKIIKENRKGNLVLITSHILNDLDEFTSHIMYLQDGNVKIFDTINNIRQATGEKRLSKAIASLMRSNFKMPAHVYPNQD